MSRRTVAESPAKPGADEVDVVLVGAGIMSTTLGVLLKELQPDLSIEMFEVLEKEAQESSSAWNNAGTGHAALCELNYTPPRSDGSIDISKALEVNVEFDLCGSSGPTSYGRGPSGRPNRSSIPSRT